MDNDIFYNPEDPSIFYKNYNTKNYISNPKLSKYEKTQVLYERVNLINNGAKVFIKHPEIYKSVIDIAEAELQERKIPFIIKRQVGTNYEYWKLSDLIL